MSSVVCAVSFSRLVPATTCGEKNFIIKIPPPEKKKNHSCHSPIETAFSRPRLAIEAFNEGAFRDFGHCILQHEAVVVHTVHMCTVAQMYVAYKPCRSKQQRSCKQTGAHSARVHARASPRDGLSKSLTNLTDAATCRELPGILELFLQRKLRS